MRYGNLSVRLSFSFMDGFGYPASIFYVDVLYIVRHHIGLSISMCVQQSVSTVQ